MTPRFGLAALMIVVLSVAVAVAICARLVRPARPAPRKQAFVEPRYVIC